MSNENKGIVLVTGGLGFVGSNLVDRLVDLGREVLVVDNLSTGRIENSNPKATVIVADFVELAKRFLNGDREHTELLEQVTDVYHLAAMTRIQPSFDEPVSSIELNTVGTVAACELAKKVGARVVYAGSSSFYGGVYKNPYTFSKWQGEEVCRMYSEIFGVQTRVARFFNVYGPRHLSDGEYAPVVAIFERQYRDGAPLIITGTGEQRRDFTHVHDICSGLICMGEDETGGTATYNLGTGTNHSINELAALFGGEVKHIPARSGEAWESLADIEATREAYDNWLPSKTLEKYVEDFKSKQDKDR